MPRPRSEMRRIKEVLRLRALLGENLSAISAGAGLARSTVRRYLQRADLAGLGGAAALDGMNDDAVEAALFPPAPAEAATRPLPDWEYVDQELRRHKHLTRKLLWLEYRAIHSDGYEFSQFKLLLAQWQKAAGRGLSMRQIHRAGAVVQVDYAGDTVGVVDADALRQAQIFVACLPCSGLIFAEATWSQTSQDWLMSHVRMFGFLGGSVELVVPDNLKAGVTHPSFYDPVINASYTALLQHFGAGALPARKRRPRDKSAVENGVLQVERWILAALRNRQFFSLAELNQAVALLVTELNDKLLSPPREGSRRSLFEAVERAALKPLPSEPYVVGEWKIECRVNPDYHVGLDHNFYSVPHELAGKRVDAFLTAASVQILHRGERAASHVRATGKNQWTTAPAHMPAAHVAVLNHTPEFVRAEAARIGIATAAYVERMLTAHDHVQQGVRSCLGVLGMVRKYPPEAVEAACRRALIAGAMSSTFVSQLLKGSRPIPDVLADEGVGAHANIRAPGYYH